ncbi:S-layer homology domain-containing protein [Alkaliphilus sp. MSJ-5]|uniref:S-layer homology domain-containing protein n=1 Tax=Alkaliphilus flagellatus TaxID=2841507 RepID=A0ABS6G0L0_9FIRM|nr:glycosyl hydrolase family 18 protein [Alkaliphilus flagellatus]MBU5675242.1 S-layer homology domain-containing protein [Alkaliphilus flagellatus]
MKRIISYIIIFSILVTSNLLVYGNTSIVMLKDIENHWINDYKEVLYTLQHLGIITGYPEDNSFRPEKQISRQEFVKALIVAAGYSIENKAIAQSFIDVNPNLWSYPYIEAAVGNGIIIPEDYIENFEPSRPITRQEMAIMVVRALEILDSEQIEFDDFEFKDKSEIPAWAASFINIAWSKGIITGSKVNEGYIFKPNDTATRAEAAIILHRFLHNKKDLKKLGFYAVKSFEQIKELEIEDTFNDIAFGWGSLEALKNGDIIFSMADSKSDYKRPSGFEEPLHLVEKAGVNRILMITEARTSLIYPFLENKTFWQAAITEIVESLRYHNFTGVLIDFENIRNREQGYRQLYLEFLIELNKELKSNNYSLSVAVQPNNVVGYYDGYDYSGISEVADEIILMAYDYYDRNNTTTPTDHAPIYKVKEALENLITEGVNPEKIILGLQVAGATQWIFRKSNSTIYPSDQIHTPAMSSVYNRLNSSDIKGKVNFNPNTMTPSFEYNVIDNAESKDIIIKYENRESIESKILLAKYYGIKGISVWRIGEIQRDILELLVDK